MKPETYLPKEAQKIFNRILKHVQVNNLEMEIDSLEMSMLAFNFWQYSEAITDGIKKGFVNEYENGTIQINGIQNIANQAYSNI